MPTYVASRGKVDRFVADSQAAAAGGDLGRKAALRAAERVRELRAPIDRIFEEQLKPRLDKLPTRAQRAAAETPEPPPNP